MQATSAPGSSAGEFVDKTDLTAGTKWTAADANAWQAELLEIITESGLTPSGGDLTQVRQAIQLLAKLVVVDEATTVGGFGITNIGDGVKVKHGYLADSSPTQDEVFNALTAAIPANGDWVMVSGSLISTTQGGTIKIITRAERISSSEIRLSYNGKIIGTNSNEMGSFAVINGSSTVLDWLSIAW